MRRRSARSAWGRWLATIAILAALGIVLHAKTQIALYHPGASLPTPAQAGAPGMRVIVLHTSDALELVSWFEPPADPAKPVLLFFMGDSGALSDRIDDFGPYLQSGYGMLLLGYRGFNGNPGTPSESHLYRDARAAVTWLGQRGYPAERLVLYGHSLGTGIAVEMALEYKARAVILEAPYTTLPDTVHLSGPSLPARWLMQSDRYDNLAKIARVRIPLLIIQGTADKVIPVEQGKALFNAATAPKVGKFLAGAGHTDLYAYGAARIVMDFLEHSPN